MAPPAQGGNQGDNSSGILWGVAAFLALLAGLWFGLKRYIVSIFFGIKLIELDFIRSMNSMLHLSNQFYDQLAPILVYAKNHPAEIQFANLMTLGDAIGDWLRFPIVFMFIVLAILVYFSNKARVYRNIYNMKQLATEEKQNWPQITPVLNLDLVNTDIDTGPWAMAMTPVQFCKRYRLLEEFKPQRREGMARKDWDRIEVVLKRGDANKLFALQLGPLWRGTKNLPPYARALFAIFVARINADSKSAASLIEQLNTTPGKFDFPLVQQLLQKHERTKDVQKVVQSHAYMLTVMAALLEKAREDGVQASADFLWLKPLDRRLWYTLNTVGRQTPYIEVAGIFAHWIAEKEAGRKLLVPMVEEATHAVEIALKEIVYQPDEPAPSKEGG